MPQIDSPTTIGTAMSDRIEPISGVRESNGSSGSRRSVCAGRPVE
jgi:hypothetical protein